MISGKMKRMRRLMPDGKSVIIPMDHGVSLGPVEGLVNMQSIVDKLTGVGVDGIVVHKGIAKNIDTRSLGLIVHLSASTKMGPDPLYKVEVCSLEEAIRIGADGVSVHINVGAREEPTMLSKLGKIVDECDEWGIPLLAMMYPRGPAVPSEYDPESVAHAARLAAELGADIVKTNYTGSVETFRRVAESCPVPIIIAGGPKMKTSKDVLQMVYDSLKAGGLGISIGRNVFQHEDPSRMARALSAIVHGGSNVEDASNILRGI